MFMRFVEKDFKPVIKFCTYNIDQAVREEQYENTKWNVREPKILELIKEMNADIYCLQELRCLKGCPTPEEFLIKIKGYKFVVGFRNPSGLAFGNAIVYNPKKLYLSKYEIKWLSDTPDEPSDNWSKDGRGAIVLCAQFYVVKDEKVVENIEPFWVFNTHFLLEEDIKTKSSIVLTKIISMYKGKFILSGDFNFFWDKEGDKQRNILADFIDVGKNAKTLKGSTNNSTFIGYEQDEFKSSLTEMKSRLDHIFTSKDMVTENPIIYTRSLYYKDMKEDIENELTHRNYPSDHLPIVTDIKF